MESLRGRCLVLSVAFVSVIVVAVASAVTDLFQVRYLLAIDTGAPVDPAVGEAIDSWHVIFAVARLGVLACCAVAFVVWFHRAHKNLKSAGLEGLRYSPGWAVGGFFVPLLNLVRPFQVMKEVWKGSAFLSRASQQGSWEALPVAPLVKLWWWFFLIDSSLQNVSSRMMERAEGLGALITASFASFAADAFEVVAALVALWLIRRISDFQEQARTRFQPERPVVSPA